MRPVLKPLGKSARNGSARVDILPNVTPPRQELGVVPFSILVSQETFAPCHSCAWRRVLVAVVRALRVMTTTRLVSRAP